MNRKFAFGVYNSIAMFLIMYRSVLYRVSSYTARVVLSMYLVAWGKSLATLGALNQ